MKSVIIRSWQSVAIGFLFAFVVRPAFATVTFEWATVENPGNAPDSTGKGSVTEVFNISKHETTNGQYVEFLNSVDPEGENEKGLYDPKMSVSSSGGGIAFDPEASSGSKYSPMADWELRPANFVSLSSAARFANWMHNGQGPGGTESGAYDMALESPARMSLARFFIPNENEWYKAAYHDPRDAAEGGPTGDDHYWFYPTRSDGAPSPDPPPGGDNSAIYDDGTHPIWIVSPTPVGSYTSTTSYYGAFDMGGNVWEWILDAEPGLRGGSYDNLPFDNLHLHSVQGPGVSYDFIVNVALQAYGFRLASILNPILEGDMNGDQHVDAFDIQRFVHGLVDAAGYVEETGMNPAAFGDLNGDHRFDSFDINPFVNLLTQGMAPGVPVSPPAAGQFAALLALRPAAPREAHDCFRITQIERSATGLELTWISEPGMYYVVEYSPACLPGSWKPVRRLAVQANGRITSVVDSQATRSVTGESYYRVRAWPNAFREGFR